MIWMVPPTVKPGMAPRLIVSAQMPWPANAASPWISTGSTLVLTGLSQPHLLGTSTAHGHRIHRFQVTGVRYQVQADSYPAPGEKLPGSAHVVFHVAAAQDAARVGIFEFRKDVGGGLTEGVRHHVQASAMAHPHHGLARAIDPRRG